MSCALLVRHRERRGRRRRQSTFARRRLPVLTRSNDGARRWCVTGAKNVLGSPFRRDDELCGALGHRTFALANLDSTFEQVRRNSMHGRSGTRLRRGTTHDRTRHMGWFGTGVVGVLLVTTLSVATSTGSTVRSRGEARATPSAAVLTAHQQAIVPPNHPLANVQAQVPFNCDQFALDNTPGCIYSALLNINYGRSLEGVGPMILPTDYPDLPPAEQLFVVFNLERTARGLPALVELDASADNDALAGSLASTDP